MDADVFRDKEIKADVTSQNLETDMWKQWHKQTIPRSPVLLRSRYPAFQIKINNKISGCNSKHFESFNILQKSTCTHLYPSKTLEGIHS